MRVPSPTGQPRVHTKKRSGLPRYDKTIRDPWAERREGELSEQRDTCCSHVHHTTMNVPFVFWGRRLGYCARTCQALEHGLWMSCRLYFCGGFRNPACWPFWLVRIILALHVFATSNQRCEDGLAISTGSDGMLSEIRM